MTTTPPTLRSATGFALLLVSLLAAATAQADSEAVPTPSSPQYKQECAACHIAFPPGLLPAGSWQKLMARLSKHYGTDASLDATSQQDLSNWLQRNAGTYKRVSEEPPQNRITQSAWFLRKHRAEEVPAIVWKRAAVGSPANCAACHTGAEAGSFNEHDVRIPK